jgi:hypothetical protein
MYTCIITEDASKKKIPDEINNGRNIPLQAAIAANAPPNAKDPVSPINTEALYRLCNRKPKQAPAIDAPNIASSDLECKTRINTNKLAEKGKISKQ